MYSISNQLKNTYNFDEIFVYIVNINDYRKNIDYFWDILSNEEKIKATECYSNELTNKYIISHGILRYIISYYTQQKPINIEFIFNKYGKPSLKNHKIQFNMAHSNELVSYVIALRNVGIDIEFHNNNLAYQEFCHAVLTNKEYDVFYELQNNDKKSNFFYNLWTRKEAFIKATGQGLSYPINTLEIMNILPGEKIIFYDEDNSINKYYYYFPLKIGPNYSGSMFIEHKISKIIYESI